MFELKGLAGTAALLIAAMAGAVLFAPAHPLAAATRHPLAVKPVARMAVWTVAPRRAPLIPRGIARAVSPTPLPAG
ncbi:MAG TPA: hypothetical protein VGB91_10550, partial [Rhizomicrobium sp.]